MTMFGMFITRDLNAEEEDELRRLLDRFNGEVALPRVDVPPASMPLPGDTANLMQGISSWGDVSIEWRNGVPLRAWRNSNPSNNAPFPPALWAAIMRYAPQDDWLPYAYLAFPESSYIEDAHNGAGEDSWGALQVNRVAWPQFSVAELTTYEGNMRAAVQIKSLQGWGAWWNSAHLVGLL